MYRRYCVDLLRLVALHMSEKVAARFDPEDVVQSAFRTLFRRTAGGEFSFDGDAGVWRLLVKISLNKLRRRIRSLKTQKRDLDRECAVDEEMLVRLSGAPSPREALAFAELLETKFFQPVPRNRSVIRRESPYSGLLAVRKNAVGSVECVIGTDGGKTNAECSFDSPPGMNKERQWRFSSTRRTQSTIGFPTSLKRTSSWTEKDRNGHPMISRR